VDGKDDILLGKWDQLKGEIRMTWGDLTDDDVDRIAGSRQKLAGQLREKYGWTQEKADSAIDDFLNRVPAVS
jgi:uncharacterized protein YjbJ (UPF0337 family)